MEDKNQQNFVQPEDVTSPRSHWDLIKVLDRGDPESYAVALGKWDLDPCLAVRWNANEDRPVGHPHSRGLPTWFILPKPLVEPILRTLDEESQRLVRNFLPANS